MEQDKFLFAISMLKGGGAERVMLSIMKELQLRGNSVILLVTNQREKECVLWDDIKFEIHFALNEVIVHKKSITCRIEQKIINIICKIYEFCGIKVPAFAAKLSFEFLYKDTIIWTRNFLKKYKNRPILAFLQPTNQIVLKSSEGLNNPIFISERSDPLRYFKTRYANYFINYYYSKITNIIFQTPYARDCYPDFIKKKSVIIPNPVSETLPISLGKKKIRKPIIVNYCRLTPEKNLNLLIDAFSIFINNHSQYYLEIIGDGPLKEDLKQYIQQKGLEDKVQLLSYQKNVHDRIKDYAMFVSSSDWEGLSNSMLESMAMGIPTICTDCGGGGARFVINNNINGLLVPIKDKYALSNAMSKIADDIELANKLSNEAIKIRTNFALSTIIEKWIKVLNNK